MQVAPEIGLIEKGRAELTKQASSQLPSVRLSRRAGIVRLAPAGMQN